MGAIMLTVAFVLGTVAGAVGHAIFESRWRAAGPEMRSLAGDHSLLSQLDKELKLTQVQREKIEQILREALRERAKLRAELGPRFNDLHVRFRARIVEVLDPEQQGKFKALVARRHERMQRLLDLPDASVPGAP